MTDRIKVCTRLILSIVWVLPFAGCGPSGVTMLKPTDMVNYEYVTCYPHKDDPSVLSDCIRYYEKKGFVKQDQINTLQM